MKDECYVVHEKDKKCAPGINFEDGSCISLDMLIEMAKAHNETETNKIKLHDSFETLNRSKYKKYLLREFSEKYKNICNTQFCWLSQPFIKKLDKIYSEELLKKTFRPSGPSGQFEWLNTLNINHVMKQYENKYKDYAFLGAVPIDFDDLAELNIKDIDLPGYMNRGIHRLGIVFNLDESYKSGSHWVASFFNLKEGKVYYFDSYGTPPEKRIRKLLRRIANFCKNELGIKNVAADHNKIRHQYEGSECGVYSINMILRLLRGDTFEEICQSKVPDKVINKCRLVYFKG